MGFWHEERFISLYNAAEMKADFGLSPLAGRRWWETYLEALRDLPDPARVHCTAPFAFCNGQAPFSIRVHVIAKGAIGPEARVVPRQGLFFAGMDL